MPAPPAPPLPPADKEAPPEPADTVRVALFAVTAPV